MRCSFDGLGEDPADGWWFVYVNRRRMIVKVLSFDGGGYWVWAKRLEAGRFAALGVDGVSTPKFPTNGSATGGGRRTAAAW